MQHTQTEASKAKKNIRYKTYRMSADAGQHLLILLELLLVDLPVGVLVVIAGRDGRHRCRRCRRCCCLVGAVLLLLLVDVHFISHFQA